MNEIRRKSLIRKMDQDWLESAADMLGKWMPGATKETLVSAILAEGKKEPALLVLLLHHGTISLLMDHCGEYIETKIKKTEKEKLVKRLLNELKNVSESDFPILHPNHAFMSSAAFAELLIHEEILPDLLIQWSDEVNDVVSTAVIAHELWNLINYYGIITPEDLLRVHAAAHEETESLPEEVLGIAQAYMELNLSDEICYEQFNGQDYFLSEYLGIDAEEILEDVQSFREDYQIVPVDTLMGMLYGIEPGEMLHLVDYITRAFDLTEEDELMLADVEFIHSIIISLRGRGAEFVPKFLHEELGWKWGVADLEARDLIFQELLDQIPRYHLKGHSVADLSGFKSEDDESEDDFDEAWMDELKFKLRKDPEDEDNFLN